MAEKVLAIATDLIAVINDAIKKNRMARQARVQLNEFQQRLAMLKPRELDALSHVVSGQRNKQIRLRLSWEISSCNVQNKRAALASRPPN